MKHVAKWLVGIGMGASMSMTALAAVTAKEAEQLDGPLTAFGAEKAGNADGSIPPYTGGLKDVPGYSSSSERYVDPYKDEKPLYTVDAKNMGQYDATLTEGTKALLKKYPTFRVEVYPTHRSVWYPDWALDNTKKNATTAKLVGQVEGDSMAGAAADGLPFQGVPFPIPKNGYEAMWNFKLHVSPAVIHRGGSAWLVDTQGGVTALPTVNEYFVQPWWDKSGQLRTKTYDSTMGFSARLESPPESAGIVFLNYYLPTAADEGQKVWFYTPGQRRVRRAPEFAYDIPIAAYGGGIFWDEVTGFTGRMDRFDFKLVGKKEMIVPFNEIKMINSVPGKKNVADHFIDPEIFRWEKHRVWVVEATRKPNARHAYKLRRFYIDEDSWCILTTENYDDAGNLWRVTNVNTFPTYDVGGLDNISWETYDLIKGNYFIVNTGAADPSGFTKSYSSADGLHMALTPDAVGAAGVR